MTLALLCRLAMRLDPVHRAEALRGYASLTQWVRSRIEAGGIAWILLVDDEPMVAIGIYAVGRGTTGYVWLAGARGWTRHIRKLAPFWRAVLKSGAYPRLACDIFVDNEAEKRWVEHLGFVELARNGDHAYYGKVL